jgi:hypothetical protein
VTQRGVYCAEGPVLCNGNVYFKIIAYCLLSIAFCLGLHDIYTIICAIKRRLNILNKYKSSPK